MSKISRYPTIDQLLRAHTNGGLVAAISRETGDIAYIDDVKSGLACNAICPVCKRDLIAKKGKIQEHHFAHRADENQAACRYAGETILHLYAKNLFAQEKIVGFPPIRMTDYWGTMEVSPEKKVKLESVELERAHEEIIPDIVAKSMGRTLFIEILVTHECDEAKRAKLSTMDVAVLEVNLSAFREIPLDQLHNEIIYAAPREIIQSRLFSIGKEKLSERDRRIRQSYQSKLEELERDNLKVREDFEVSKYLSFINVPSSVWQDEILRQISGAQSHNSTESLKEFILKKGWLHPLYAPQERKILSFCRYTEFKRIRSVYGEIDEFLITCADQKMIYRVDKNWNPVLLNSNSHEFPKEVKNLIARIQARAPHLRGEFQFKDWYAHIQQLRRTKRFSAANTTILNNLKQVTHDIEKDTPSKSYQIRGSVIESLFYSTFYRADVISTTRG